MEEKKIINEVIVDNKLKKIYMELNGYQELSEAEQNFFDQIFTILWFDEKLEHSNKYLAERLKYSESTVEKRFKALANNNLVTRELHRSKDPVTCRWETKRKILLDPFVRSFISKKLDPNKNTVEAEVVTADEVVPVATAPVQIEEVEVKKKKKKLGFNFEKVNV